MASGVSAETRWAELGLFDRSSVKVRFFETRREDRRVLRLRYEGTYGFGSGGNSDARFMRAMGVAALEMYEPSAVIVDLSDVAYEWGDMLDSVFDLGRDELPRAVLVGPDCRHAIGTLLFGVDDPRDPVEREGFFDD